MYILRSSNITALLLVGIVVFLTMRLGCASAHNDSKVAESELDCDISFPFGFVPFDKEASPTKQVWPEYPRIAVPHKEGLTAWVVWVKILVCKDGKVKQVVIEKSDDEIFNDNAVNAAMQWVFAPAIRDSVPVPSWVVIPFRFVATH
jgi:TonB family protein